MVMLLIGKKNLITNNSFSLLVMRRTKNHQKQRNLRVGEEEDLESSSLSLKLRRRMSLRKRMNQKSKVMKKKSSGIISAMFVRKEGI